jgi:uncharacterized protein YcbX
MRRRQDLVVYRGNILVEGEVAFIEESWGRLNTNQTILHVTAPCKRCPWDHVL